MQKIEVPTYQADNGKIFMKESDALWEDAQAIFSAVGVFGRLDGYNMKRVLETIKKDSGKFQQLIEIAKKIA